MVGAFNAYYILNICVMMDSIVMEKSNLRIVSNKSGLSYVMHGPIPNDFRTLNGEMVKGRHLWREKIYPRDIYISDQLYAEYTKKKFIGVDRLNFIKVTLS